LKVTRVDTWKRPQRCETVNGYDMRQSAPHQASRYVGLVNCSLNESLDRSSQQSTMNQAEDYQSYVTVNESNESLKRSFEYVVYVNRVNRFSKINRLHAPTMLSGNGP